MSLVNKAQILQKYEPPTWAANMRNIPSYYVKLAQRHTAIHEWNLEGLNVPNGFTVGIKRDDMTGSVLSGNKVRKLEFLLGEAIEQGCDSVITSGSAYSNHCRTTAIASRQLGLKCQLLVDPNNKEMELGYRGNLLLIRLTGCSVQPPENKSNSVACQREMEKIQQDIKKQSGSSVYVIPCGGSSYTGMFGYISCFEELIEQNVLVDYTDLVLTIASGGTACGIAIANYLAGSKLKIHAVCISRTAERHFKHIQDELNTAGLENIKAQDIIDIIEGHGGEGYGVSTKEELEDIVKVTSTTGIVLDPIYNVKSVRGMIAEMKMNPTRFKGRKVLYIHTGGIFGLFEGRIESLLSTMNPTDGMTDENGNDANSINTTI